MSAKERYLQYCQTASDVPIFFSPAWLSLYGTSWQVLMAEEGSSVLFFVYFDERKAGFSFVRNPQFTPYHGFLPVGEIVPSLLQRLTKKIISQITLPDEMYLDCLPGYQFFSDQIKQKRTSILTLQDKAVLFAQFKPSLQRQIRKAQRTLHLKEDLTIETFISLYKTSLTQRGVKPFGDEKLLSDIIAWSLAQKKGKLFAVEDETKQLHAALFLVFDHQSAYYLVGGTDKQFNGSGAMSWVMWEAIQFAQDQSLKFFDFEGSEQDSIQKFFMQFNPQEVGYNSFQLQRSTILKWLRKWQQR